MSVHTLTLTGVSAVSASGLRSKAARNICTHTVWTCFHLSTAHTIPHATGHAGEKSLTSLLASGARFSPTHHRLGAMPFGRAWLVGPSAQASPAAPSSLHATLRRGAGQGSALCLELVGSIGRPGQAPGRRWAHQSCAAPEPGTSGACPLLWCHSPAGSLQVGRTSAKRLCSVPHAID